MHRSIWGHYTLLDCIAAQDGHSPTQVWVNQLSWHGIVTTPARGEGGHVPKLAMWENTYREGMIVRHTATLRPTYFTHPLRRTHITSVTLPRSSQSSSTRCAVRIWIRGYEPGEGGIPHLTLLTNQYPNTRHTSPCRTSSPTIMSYHGDVHGDIFDQLSGKYETRTYWWRCYYQTLNCPAILIPGLSKEVIFNQPNRAVTSVISSLRRHAEILYSNGAKEGPSRHFNLQLLDLNPLLEPHFRTAFMQASAQSTDPVSKVRHFIKAPTLVALMNHPPIPEMVATCIHPTISRTALKARNVWLAKTTTTLGWSYIDTTAWGVRRCADNCMNYICSSK